MASVNVQEKVAASADQVWQLMGDFGGLVKWADPNLVKSCDCDGNSPGVIRTLTLADGSVIRERLDAIDGGARRFTYTILGESPLPVLDYVATAKVTELDANSCQVDWQSTFAPVGEPAEAEKVITGVYTGGVAGIRKALGV